jgi:tetratricopeptide (TPR) repeat protein
VTQKNKTKSPNTGVAVEETCKLAHQRLVAGKIDAAQELFHRVLKVAPGHAPALHFLGLTYAKQGNPQQAVLWIKQAVRAAPNYTNAYANLACLLAGLGRWEESVAAAGRTLQLDPNLTDARILLAQGLAHLGRHEDVRQIVHDLSQIGKHDEAIALLNDLVQVRPDDVRYLAMLGESHIALEQHAQAAQVYERAVALKPDSPKFWNNLGAAAKFSHDPQRSMEAFQKAVELAPSNSNYRMKLAQSLMDMARISMDTDKTDQAIRELNKVIELQPDNAHAHVYRSCLNLVLGKVREGWDESEWRHKLADSIKLDIPGRQWDGADPRGKRLMVHWEQGFGDVIQFARFLPVLAQMGAQVIMACPLELQRLMTSLKGISRVADQGQVSYDAWTALLSIPRLLRTDMDSLPKETPYLWAPQEDCDYWRERLAGDRGFRVGLVWATSSKLGLQMPKAIPPQTLAGLLDVPGVTFYSLFVGASAGDLAILGDRIIDLSPELKDFAVTAAVMKQMDLIISIDTAAAHLAGAIGAPVWVLLGWLADWRWMRDRSDSPWYPTARLFRQPATGDWESLVSQVRQELVARRNRWGGR